ncbi:MAG: metallophosphoesterase [Acidobacteria bacterium]|nr:metallophosphoesterase [Acidobacteriota bacterium]
MSSSFQRGTAAALAALAAVIAACGGSPGGPSRPPPPPPPVTAILVGAGDIAVCGSAGTEATAALLDGIDGTVFTAGDNAYFQGSADDFRRCYDPTWGRHKERTLPAPGNHEYESAGAAPYFAYFGERAGPAGRGYYSARVGAWHVVSLNSNVPAGEGSAQLQWLRDDLAQHSSFRCVAAIWHHPMFTSGPNGPEHGFGMRDVWRTLQQARVELVVNGHEHFYERFAALDTDGRPNPGGIRLFIAGTGGASLYDFGRIATGSEARGKVFGVLKLTLDPTSYSWEFIPISGTSFRDSGRDECR